MNKNKALSMVNPVYLKGICHRGLHNSEYSENGIKAFENAIIHGRAFELDIHLTSDNELVVFHDSDTSRMTGKEGIIEHMTLSEIRSNYRLPDGGQIPTLREVLDLTDEKVPMVIELKAYEKNHKALAKRAIRELESIRDKKNFIIISFDPRALWAFGNHGFIRQLLVAKSDEYTYIFRHFFEGVDLEYVLFNEKRVQRYCKKHFANVWTIETEKALELVKGHVDTMTFQHLDPDVITSVLTPS